MGFYSKNLIQNCLKSLKNLTIVGLICQMLMLSMENFHLDFHQVLHLVPQDFIQLAGHICKRIKRSMMISLHLQKAIRIINNFNNVEP
jgi:hypothetical protein